MARKLTPKNFVLRAIENLRKGEHKGIHVVYSGLNTAIRQYYNVSDAREILDPLLKSGEIISRPVKGGIIVYNPKDAPPSLKIKESSGSPDSLIDKIVNG
jgi:hypothetical protein